MNARVWTLEELGRVHPLPKGEADGIRSNRPPWFWRIDASGPVAVALLPSDDWEVWADARGCLCSSNGDPPLDVALPVILASKGLDSLGAMADALEARAVEHIARAESEPEGKGFAQYHSGKAYEAAECAAMLRRGRVAP